MHVAIDTNILRKDFLLKKVDLDILFKYLRETNSKLIIPRIVIEEIIGKHNDLLNEASNSLQSAKNKLAEAGHVLERLVKN
ncbi:MAG: DUF4935 domain-containing protein [Candidatus Melainabacteria bacterium]|nr:DUF4935 domain-containing protein [Candidatus Melainabacteria bacterium]